MVHRRTVLKAALAAPLLHACGSQPTPWERNAYRKPEQSRVAIVPAREYGPRLVDILKTGLALFDLPVHGKTVVLKPNFVEYDAAGVVNTHPSLIAAAIDAFRRLGARRVTVAEGPGHDRDVEHVITASGLQTVLREYRAGYVDLNYDDTRRLALRSRYTSLGALHLPETILDADLVVSMPKLKTHHWAGVTLSMKNFFGVVPGAVYGWPKNALHWAGIHESIVDINSTLPVKTFAIIDGIVGMDGNGPIQGDAKPCGVLVLSDDLVAADATAARVMTIDPARVRYIEQAGRFLGNIAEERIVQIADPIETHRTSFRLLPSFAKLRA
jgi:uncharacterized protein (DUF362 family)